ncbi:MAG: peptide chain release factor 1 [Dehalococcoidales bacterium]|jgi:peptide chain release factor 1|nr:peptide chain release factor 1 [Dehalococcoidales bacterium]MDP6576395.1 peptide chain release factor 1 [Dehalococcoidales bacterium]|tara:strand:+ start:3604 stop:4674 length:1071 start_codon:yes stop_codon:yes gene_type:complete
MLDRLARIEKRYQELDEQIAEPEIASDLKQLQTLAQERAGLEELVTKYREYKATSASLAETRAMLGDGQDGEMAALIKQEIESLETESDRLIQELKVTLLPRDPNDAKDIIMEIRAGAGGDEAGLFAADLFRMYSRYAQTKNWGTDIISLNESGIGSLKEIILEIKGKGAFSRLKYESGVHRVQRVPTTESSGRIHTSTATIAVLPKAEEVDITISPDDLKTDIFHSGGAGGQNVNKVATAVRLTHLPTGMVVTCQDERSQLQNRIKAMSVLRSRLLDIERRQQEEKIVTERRSQVGTGDRSEKIRTYNFPQDRISDHRINLTLHNLPRIMEGALDELIDAIATSHQVKQLKEQTA